MARDYFGPYDIFRDPVHGFIKVYNAEREIINTKAFQRLRRIKQLALTHYVYHGATHTRFGHSLGVMEVADRVFGIVTHKDKHGPKILSTWIDNEDNVRKMRVLLRLVALLHDIGHAPFSHVGDALLPFIDRDEEKRVTHEDLGARIIKEDPEIGQIIDSTEEVTKENVAQFLDKTRPDQLIQQICMGPLDADKIDYLIRDSLYTGVKYGIFDSDRLVHMMCVVKDKINEEATLGIEEGGVHAAEAMALASFYMFQQVYFHKTRRIYDIHLKAFLRDNLESEQFPKDIDEFINLDDICFERLLGEQASKDPICDKTVLALARRKHFKFVISTSDYPGTYEKEKFRANLKELKSKYEDLEEDNVINAPHKWDSRDNFIFVRPKRGGDPVEIGEYGNLIKRLDPIQISRIYSPRESFKEVWEKCKRMDWK